jgi:hypothetical protein
MIGAAVVRLRRRVAALAATALAGARDEGDLTVLLEVVWAAIEVERALAPAGRLRPACRPGCAECCRINVGTLAIEGAVVAARLRAQRPAVDAAAAAGRLLEFHERVRWLEDRERAAERLLCPFLDADARCTIHAFRPLACRGVSSLDPAECRRALSRFPEDDDGDGQAGVVRMDLLQKALHDEAFAALAEALAERGLDARCRDVSGMTAAFLADRELAAAFLAGTRVPLA